MAMATEFSPSLSVYQATPRSLHPSTRASLSLSMASPPSASLAEHHNKPSSSSSSSSSSGIQKMEPFNRSRISRLIKEPSLLEKAEHAISDRCSILEGDDAYSCWEAFFEFEDMKEACSVQCNVAATSERSTACRPLERLENLVRQSGGVVSLINNVRMLAKLNKMHKTVEEGQGTQVSKERAPLKHEVKEDDGHLHFFPEPSALPPSEEELELERSAKMPESPFTRVLRAMGVPSPWFSHQAGFESV